MKYQVGDEILVLLSNEEGRVIEIMDDKMVMIEVRGVKFPAYMDQIDFPYFKRFTEKKLFPQKAAPQKIYLDQIPKEKVQKNDSKEESGVWLNIIPKFSMDDFNDEVVDSLKIYLSNRNRVSYQFIYNQAFVNESNFSIESTIAPFTDFYIHDISFEDINDSPSFSVDFSLTEPHKKKADHFEAIVKIKPKQLFQKIEILKEDDKANISYPLFETYPDKVEDNHIAIDTLRNAGYKVYDVSKIKQNIQQARSVIDLHIEKIMDTHSHLSNAEILHFQLAEFEKWFELALLHNLPSIIIIHGVGKGKLKAEVHDLLKVKPSVKSFINQYSDFYGYGATEVVFQY